MTPPKCFPREVIKRPRKLKKKAYISSSDQGQTPPNRSVASTLQYYHIRILNNLDYFGTKWDLRMKNIGF